MDIEASQIQHVAASSYAIEAARSFFKGKEGEETLTEKKITENDDTMVTVVCITYAHEAFIAQALDSFLMQKTNFKFKIFVGEDCGPDGTADIVREYAKKYPDIIVPFIREKNMGAQHNLIDLCQHATSPYIAFCEGDDYWVDEYKLQKQFDYMESHPDIRACTTQTEILAPEDWHLRSWYKALPDGKLLLPDSIPGYQRKETFSPAYIININVAHTSTHFYRWNYDLEIPDWYYEGIIGDTPLLLLQLGETSLGHIPEITSVYRINEGSIFFDKDRDASFLRTRLDYVRYLSGLKEYAEEYFPQYPITVIENRIKLETANYLKTLIKLDKLEDIPEFFTKYSEAGKLALTAFISFYMDQRALTAAYSWPGYQMAVRNRYFRRCMKPVVRMALRLSKCLKWLKGKKNLIRGKLRNLVSFVLYWRYTFTPKDENLWVFSGFNKKSYMDNTKYFYEYVLEQHPEIRAVWLTLDKNVFQRLTEENKPVVMMRTRECRKLVSHASIAVTDHFRMSDYDAFSGLNDRLKIVQLWHGIGLKTIGDLKNTKVPGVRFSDDILPQEGDSGAEKVLKRFRYIRHAYYRELFEKYFMLVCPGQERVEQVAKPLHIPLDNCFFSGHPRNILLHREDGRTGEKKILYAPTYRWNAKKEREVVQKIADAAEIMQLRMEQLDAHLVIRLHPHTWRDYSRALNDLAEKYDRIQIDQNKDIYQSLSSYSVVISDYSSIAYDFILLDRPVVFFNYDFEEFAERECHLNYDYDMYSPGTKSKTWEETLDAVQEYMENPEKDSEWRCRVRDEFYNMSVNDENNSERIVTEIKRRLTQEKRASK